MATLGKSYIFLKKVLAIENLERENASRLHHSNFPWQQGAVVAGCGVGPPVSVERPAPDSRIALWLGGVLQDQVGEAGEVPPEAVRQAPKPGILLMGIEQE